MGCVYSVHMDAYCSLSMYLSNHTPFSLNSLPLPQITILQSVVSDEEEEEEKEEEEEEEEEEDE